MSARVLALFAGGPDFVKASRTVVTVDEGGVLGDRHHGRAPERALLLVPSASYEALAADGIAVPHGSLGENLVVSGLPARGLAPGTRLALGEVRAVVEAPCTVCRALTQVHPRLPKLAYGRRGVYLRIVQGGPLHAGDPVRIVTGMSASAPPAPAAEPNPRSTIVASAARTAEAQG
ncbi:MAG: MOSC domain-containing protein [Deinococcus-Thermus bacterium]|jgi:MOSC domain-containing protein YiiM|nr:MOSC domain-containing protein [Deinococcota bacterium]